MSVQPVSSLNPQSASSSPPLKNASTKPVKLFQRLKGSLQGAVDVKKIPKQEKLLKTQVTNNVTKGLKEVTIWSKKNPDFKELIPTLSDLSSLCKRFIEISLGKKESPIFEATKSHGLLVANGQGYLILFKIGEGGEKKVYLCINVLSGECLAISELSYETCKDYQNKALTKEFFDKIKELSSAKGKEGIIPLIDLINIYKKDGTLVRQFIVQKWCKDGSLFDLMATGTRLSPTIQKKYIINMLNGAIELFKCNFLHKDIKPENYLMSEEGSEIFLGDIGSIQEKVPLTFAYAPPEGFEGRPFDEKSVVWALGQTIYFLLCGEPTEIFLILNDMFKTSSENELKEKVGMMSVESFKLDLPWEQKDYQFKTNSGEALVISMLRADPEQRCSLKQALEFVKKMDEEKLSFTAFPPMPLPNEESFDVFSPEGADKSSVHTSSEDEAAAPSSGKEGSDASSGHTSEEEKHF